jgi:hypothetical protein
VPISTAEQSRFRLRCRTGQSGDSGAGEGYSLAAALLLGNAGMKFSEIANRLTGISTPLVGVSWQPSDLEVSAARRVIAFLEDRRVLYAPDELEVPDHCVRSVLEIRHFLSDELGKHDSGSGFAGSLRAMRAACRKFLDRVGVDGRETVLYANHQGHRASWTFYRALGEMRGTFGVHVAKIAAEFKLDAEDRLAAILPARADTDSDDDDRHPARRTRPK